MNYTYPEIKSQYEALRRTYEYILERRTELSGFFKTRSHRSLAYIGCGSSYYLCQSAELSARVRLGVPAVALAAGDLLLNYRQYLKMLEGSLMIVPTRSGSTSEVLLAVTQVKALLPVPVLAITCVENSELSQVADLTLELPWAFDESVCQTRTVTNLYLANLLIVAIRGGDEPLIADIDSAIRQGEAFMSRYEPALRDLAAADWQDAVVLADGEMQGIACEGALAFTEIARVPGRYYHLLDVRHGPMVLINDHTLVIVCLNSRPSRYQDDLIRDLLQKGATVVTYSDAPLPTLDGVSLEATSGLNLDDAVRGIPFIFIPQALAYYKAIQKGINPDQPAGLDPWIKL